MHFSSNNMSKIIIFFIVRYFVASAKMFESELNVNDILRSDLMPTYFMVDGENQSIEGLNHTTSKPVGQSINGSIDAALSTLDFHRYPFNVFQEFFSR